MIDPEESARKSDCLIAMEGAELEWLSWLPALSCEAHRVRARICFRSDNFVAPR
jgi:hypothetical protein